MKNYFRESFPFKRVLFAGLLIMLSTFVPITSCSPKTPQLPEQEEQLPVTPENNDKNMETQIIEVVIDNLGYILETLNIPAGTAVVWTNTDSMVHTVTDRNRSFDSGNIPSGGTFTFTFDERGTFDYYCTLHPYMTGKVVVY